MQLEEYCVLRQKRGKKKCTSCQKCIKGCPVNALELVDGVPEKVRKDHCIDCTFCLDICPQRMHHDTQNIYDNQKFYKEYQAMRNSPQELNQVLEQPAIKSLLPSCNHASVLELGCGNGQFCNYLIDQGADKVIGVDVSKNMLQDAAQYITDNRITLIESSIEEFEFGYAQYDLVVSSLAFHYINDLNAVFDKIQTCLKDRGYLIFSMEHPIITCSHGIHPGWHKNDQGKKLYWPVDVYSYEGSRTSYWFVEGVIRYHRKFSSIINGLVDNGFVIERVLEPHAVEQAETERPFLLEEKRRPSFLTVKARKLAEDS
ncbi:MAG: methyltransferase domain-containing protein [Candidatus Electrothrix sp. MAN1_4]|nr:methyltransferase domain-containing protein [Candidatus Electrothrix sp. MAN1_4]